MAHQICVLQDPIAVIRGRPGGHTGGQEVVRLGQGLGVMMAHECKWTRRTDSETASE